MLKFFRNIRRRLLANDKIGSYLKYAFGEIFLVVIGILIALQINNWNERRQEKAVIKTHLQNMIADLRSDSLTLQRIEVASLFRYHSLQYLLQLAEAKPFVPAMDKLEIPPFKGVEAWRKPVPEDYEREFIHLTFLWSNRVPNYTSHQATLVELKSTGMYSLLKNQELKNAINDYYDAWHWRLRDVMSELVEDWQQTLISDGVITSNIYQATGDPVSLIKNHPERIAIIYRLMRETGWWAQSVVVINEIREYLVSLLQSEIAEL